MLVTYNKMQLRKPQALLKEITYVFKFTRDQEMNEVISRRQVRTIAYLGVFLSQVISSTPLVRYVAKYASSGTLERSLYCVHRVTS